MNIDGLGESIIETLFNKKYINDISDIYILKDHINEIKNIDGFGEKLISNLLESIEKSKNNPLDRLIFGLGIRHIGSRAAKLLCKKYSNLDEIISADVEELKDIVVVSKWLRV